MKIDPESWEFVLYLFKRFTHNLIKYEVQSQQ